jgi:hypothetical protein
LVKIANGLSSAALNLLAVGVALPLILDLLAVPLSSYIALPPSSARWTAFILFGACFAVTGFLRSAYSKGDFPWLFGRLGGGVVDLALFYYLFLLLPSSVASAGSVVESSGLLLLLGLAIALSYGYLILDFVDARQTKREKPASAGLPVSSCA